MEWILQHWQTLAALAIVGVTTGILVRGLVRRVRRGDAGAPGCGGGGAACDCPTTRAPRPPR